MRYFLLSALLALFCCYGSIAVGAQSLRLDVPGSDSNAVSIERMTVDVSVTGPIATTTCLLTFRNKSARVLEGTLTFPLPDGAAVTRYAIDINSKLREAVPVPKARGTTVLEAIENRRVDPGLLERIEGAAYRTRIYPIPVLGTRMVLIAYQQPLESRAGGGLRYSFPLSSDRGGRMAVSFRATVFGNNAAPHVETPANAVFRKASDTWTAQLPDVAGNPVSFIIPQDRTIGKLVVQEANQQSYCLIQPPARSGSRPRILPHDLCIVWDASLSGLYRNHDAEMALLDAYFRHIGRARVSLVVFSNAVQERGSYQVSQGGWNALRERLRRIVYDGATTLPAIDFRKLPGSEILLFSDGISTWSDGSPKPSRVPLWAIASSARTDFPALRALTAPSGGAAIVLADSNSISAALTRLTTEPLQLLRISSNGPLTEVYPRLPQPASGISMLTAIAQRSNATITLHYGYGRSETEKYNIAGSATSAAPADAPLERIWAGSKLAALDENYERAAAEIERLGARYGIVTRNTSLIVLEEVADYLRYGIAPPEELREEYNRLLQERRETTQTFKRDRDEDISAAAEELQDLWRARPATKHKKPTQEDVTTTPQPPPIPMIDTLRPGIGGIAGFVRNERGEPVVGALVKAFGVFPPSAKQIYLMQSITDYTGHFALRPLAAGTYVVKASKLNIDAFALQMPVRQNSVSTVNLPISLIQDSLRKAQIRPKVSHVPGPTSIRGTLSDDKGEPVVNAAIAIIQEGIVRGQELTDFDGAYWVKPLSAGRYDVKFTYQGNSTTVTGVEVKESMSVTVNAGISTAKLLQGVSIHAQRIYERPILNMERPGGVSTKSGDEIQNAPTRNTSDIAALSTQSGYSRAARATGDRANSNRYVIDGMQINPGAAAFTNLPPNSMETTTTYSWSPAARYGDTTGGRIRVNAGSRFNYTQEDDENGITTVPYSYDSSLLGNLRKAARDKQYSEYLVLRERQLCVPSFYFAAAAHFIAAGRKDLGMRILSNLAELETENYEVYKMLGYRLKQLGEYGRECEVFRKVLKWRPQDPQSLRDYGLALADAGQYGAALDTLMAALTGDIDESLQVDFEGIESTLLPEIANLAALHSASLRANKNLPKGSLQNMPSDIRVVINWNRKNTDIDLWVTDPKGEKCYYANSTTALGGFITNDFTEGFGPEQFMLRKAVRGKYKIEVDYYGDDQVTSAGPTTVMAEVYTGWGTPAQKRQIIVLQMKGREDDGVYIGEFTFAGK